MAATCQLALQQKCGSKYADVCCSLQGAQPESAEDANDSGDGFEQRAGLGSSGAGQGSGAMGSSVGTGGPLIPASVLLLQLVNRAQPTRNWADIILGHVTDYFAEPSTCV